MVPYPQTTAWAGDPPFSTGGNPKGCWNWWGYSGRYYHRRDGKQIRAVAAMIDALIGSEVLGR